MASLSVPAEASAVIGLFSGLCKINVMAPGQNAAARRVAESLLFPAVRAAVAEEKKQAAAEAKKEADKEAKKLAEKAEVEKKKELIEAERSIRNEEEEKRKEGKGEEKENKKKRKRRREKKEKGKGKEEGREKKRRKRREGEREEERGQRLEKDNSSHNQMEEK